MMPTSRFPKRNRFERKAVTMTMVIVAALLLAVSCRHKPVMNSASFVHLPVSGWQRSMPLVFKPSCDDSTATFNLFLAVRHQHDYAYRNLALVVDVVALDKSFSRRSVNMELADEYGNWRGGGFGSMYQDTVCIACCLKPKEAQSVIVWQAMDKCDTLKGVTDLGLICRPQ